MDSVVLWVVGVLHNCCLVTGGRVPRVRKLPFDVGVNIFGVLDYVIDTIQNAENKKLSSKLLYQSYAIKKKQLFNLWCPHAKAKVTDKI